MKKTLLCFLFLLPTFIFAQISSIIHCAGDNVFDLTSRYDELTKDRILNPGDKITIKYYTKDTHATNDIYAVSDPKNFVFNEWQLSIYANLYVNNELKIRYSFLIILNRPLSIYAATVTNPTCGNQRLSVGAVGGGVSYKYSLDGINYQSESFFDNVSPGTYTIHVKDNYDCTATIEKVVTPVAPLTATSLKIDNSCNGFPDGRIEVTPIGGVANYSYSKDGGTNYQSFNIFSNLAAGQYNMMVKDASGCTFPFQVEIVSPAILHSYVTATNVSALGNNDAEITVTATGGTPEYSYLLRDISGIVIRPFQLSNRFPNLDAGTYMVEVRDKKGCTFMTQITIPAPTAPLNASITTIDGTCDNPSGAMILVNATGGSGSYLYSINDEPYSVSNIFPNLASGNYVVNVKDSQNAIVNIPVVIKSYEPLIATANYTKIENCSINYDSIITITASGGKMPYQYAVNQSTSYKESNTFFGAAPGEHTIYVRDANGCIFTKTLTIDSPVLLTATVTVNEAEICGGKSFATINVSGGKEPYSYSFNQGSIYSNVNTAELSAGYYTLFAKDANGCIVSQSVLITPNSPLTSTLVAYTNTTTPDSNDGSITMNATGGTLPYSYSITNSNNAAVFPAQASNTFTNLAPGFYSIVVKDAKGCLSQTIEVAILAPSVTPQLTAVVDVIQPDCMNPMATITILASGGSGGYQYSIDNGITYTASNTFIVYQAGNYIIKVRDAENAEYSTVLAVEPSDPLHLNVAIVSPVTCQQNGAIFANAIGGKHPISYSINGAPFSDANIFENLLPGVYTITAKDNNGCTETTVINLETPIPLTATVTIENQTAIINATGGSGELKYAVSPNLNIFSSQNVYTNLAPGDYTAVIQDVNGCFIMLAFVIEVPAPSADGKTIVNIEFKQGQTLGDLVIEGQNIKWYSTPGSSPTGKTSKSAETPLPLSTVLVDGVTYYASQTINGIESKERLAVTAKVNGSLSTPDFQLANFKFYPNPVKHILSIKNQSNIDHIQIFSVSGKSVLSKNINSTSAEIDLSGLSTGMYILNVRSDGKEKAFKFVKE
ncbi:T9SS type A sorting domain-containing protein [Flavobacterium quisquiliarum]|uniref:T9SS type A sorting domain-containing protein n=1 Tax=Flavobacterium quisquiliarum TaxID=1834436 RepID=A0ABV8W785_9FLAO|nr:T9SS type A sorting domain-containing protein [Flavobacterium quisquiliarum]MBW1657393.1 T9SS type A sorting domain-containing protein [Flavobacterium quisquiliarum]NWL01906.1 hypothetical protein [Flavobacterium collinsii]